MQLSDYQYKIVYVPEKDNVVADFLSRMQNELEECDYDKWNELQLALIHDRGEADVKGNVWNKEYEADQTLSDVKVGCVVARQELLAAFLDSRLRIQVRNKGGEAI
ncbi:hypothetical protein NDU88_002303 [Pleurodeles waltl]|uniref:Uncharacterized protein n=1 Tax=Pleurodeles waltl TaxID=8319 RepID=A0AAV7VCH0_PLEWA|nr:hypothetical protein NDU88_002303 [Pleurodeles waltl]